MSDSGNDTGAAGPAPVFTEREMQMLAWAMQSLKSGPPEIDYEKLAHYAGMTNVRSAGNAWAKIRNKLNTATTDGVGAAPATVKKTPQKKKAAAEKAGDDDEDVTETPKKSPRKRTPKKAEVDGEPTTPKKRGRPAKNKKASEETSQEASEETSQEASDETMEDANVKAPIKSEDAKSDEAKSDEDMGQQEI